MLTTAPNIVAAKLINRILGDYPLARERLAAHARARIDVTLGVLTVSIRLNEDGRVEPIGEGATDVAQVTFNIPLSAVPRLIKKDESAYREIAFTGDSELAHTLSNIARNVEWDVGEDLSQLFGGGTVADIVAERLTSGAKSITALRDEVGQRFTENMAEYLVHERNAFVTEDALEALTRDNETLRDDVARLEARVARLRSHFATV
jgi:ubiquinone biosynthesis accessory factor UbiJ